MSSTYQAHISDYTKSISVDGKNQISVSVTFTDKKSGSYDNELYIEFGDKYFYKYLSDTTPQTISFTIPVEWLSEIPDSDIGTGKIKLHCYNMGKFDTEYNETKPFTVLVPEKFKPEVSNLTVEMQDMKFDTVDYAVYGLTRPAVAAMVTSHFTSPLKKWSITGGGVTASGNEFNLSNGDNGYNFFKVGEFIRTFNPTTSFTLTVEDGRGRKASVTSDEFYVHQYNRPIVKSLSAYRTDKDGITQADGDYIKFTVEGGISPIRDSEGVEINSLQCYLSWKEVKDDSYGNFKAITNNQPFIFEADKELNFDIRCTLRDKYFETVAYCSVIGDSKDFNIVDGGGGAAIGGKATKGYFDVAYNSRFQKGISATEKITSREGLVSTGTKSKGDFLSFGEANRLVTERHSTPNGTVVDSWGDFNDCTTIGVYGVWNNEDVSSSNYYRVLNAPCEKAGTLRVYNATGNIEEYATEKRLMQEYVVYDGSAIYRRCLSKERDTIDVEWPTDWSFGDWQHFSFVEEGTSGNWVYEKLSSGIVKCYGSFPHAFTGTSAAGVLFSETVRVPLPDGLFKTVPAFAFGGFDVVGSVSVQLWQSSSTEITVLLNPAYQYGTGTKCTVSLYVVGRWK